MIPTKKLKNWFQMPVFGLGTWQMWGRLEHDAKNDDERDIRAIQTAIDLGITHLDTAELYANGYSEIILWKAIKNYNREKLFIVSKVQQIHLWYDDIIESCKKTLERLETSYLDLYLMHRYSPEHPLKESIRALDKLVEAWKIKNIGVSNFNKEHLTEAQSYTKNKIVCNQVHYNLEFREPEKSWLLKYCQKNDIFLVAWRPIGKWNLLQEIPEVIESLCKKYNKTPAQVAINWLLSQENVLTLTKTSNKEHLIENLGALGWEMTQEDVELIREKFPNQKNISDVVPLG